MIDNLWRWIESLWSPVFNCKISGAFLENLWYYALKIVDIGYYLKPLDSVRIGCSEAQWVISEDG